MGRYASGNRQIGRRTYPSGGHLDIAAPDAVQELVYPHSACIKPGASDARASDRPACFPRSKSELRITNRSAHQRY